MSIEVFASYRSPASRSRRTCITRTRLALPRTLLAFMFICVSAAAATAEQSADETAAVRAIDAAVKARFDVVSAYTATEHYSVFRNRDESHPAAEMTVRTEYRKDAGKNYTVLSASGSSMLRKLVLDAILDREREINTPGVREHAWITSDNYQMKLKPDGTQRLDGRDCLALSIVPRQKAPNLIVGTIWVDRKDGTLVQIQGIASKSVSHFTGPAEVLRQYTNFQGFSMATHARAVSNSLLFGTTVVTIDYSGYKLDTTAAR